VRFAFLFTACLAFAGCVRPVERGEALYQDGRYVEAAEMFELTEPRLATMPAEGCAVFGLYRGLTYLRLDDVASARKWLAYAASVEQKSPGMLLPEQRRLLERGWAELERRAGPLAPEDGPGADKIATTATPALGVAPPRSEGQPAAPVPSAAAPAVQ
jgi:hypothetical protein